MAIYVTKRDTLRAELIRLVAEARANETSLDMSRRRSPGPLTDEEWVEFITFELNDRPGNRTYTVDQVNNRIINMTRRGQ